MNNIQKFVVGVAAIVVRKGKILALKRAKKEHVAPNRWETIAGKVEFKEDPLDSLCREIKEESGLNVRVNPLPIDLFHTFRGDDPMILIIYSVEYVSGDVRLSPEHDSYEWISSLEFKKRTNFKRLSCLIEKLLMENK